MKQNKEKEFNSKKKLAMIRLVNKRTTKHCDI